MSSFSVLVEVAPQKINVCFNTVKTRTITFGEKFFTGDGTTVIIPTDSAFIYGSALVFVNGIIARKGAGYTFTEGSDLQSIVFNIAPVGGAYPDEIYIHYAEA